MTTWTGTTPSSTAWATDTIDELSDVVYNSLFVYNQDYLTYNGDYIITETDWAGVTQPSTAWTT